MASIFRRDGNDNNDDLTYGPSTYIFIIVVLLAGCSVASLILVRRRQQRALRAAILPTQHRRSRHQRTLTITTTPSGPRGESVFVYDEKMHLIANSHAPPNSCVPEIHVTFPDEDEATGQRNAGRVVVLRISDTGSVGLEPLQQEPLPPYSKTGTESFHTLDLERMGGLREKASSSTPRYS